MSLTTICLPIQSELRGVEAELSRHTASEVELVSAAAQYVLQNGGKRVRPALLLLTAKMLGAPVEKAISLASSVEMIHAASLMHDDVLDNATLRRGKMSANVKWGNQISILVGDFLWCKASEICISEGNNKIMSAIIEAVRKTTEGEIQEIVKSSNFNLTKDEYLNIIKLKTAMLFACSCQVGAILAGASQKTEQSLYNFGLNVGIAFQLTDDVLDYMASDEKFGKKAGTDLCEGRLTLPVILAFQKCGIDEAQFIRESLLANALEVERFGEIKNILKQHGTIDASLDMARMYAGLAKEELSSFKHSLEKDSLIALADQAVSRSE